MAADMQRAERHVDQRTAIQRDVERVVALSDRGAYEDIVFVKRVGVRLERARGIDQIEPAGIHKRREQAEFGEVAAFEARTYAEITRHLTENVTGHFKALDKRYARHTRRRQHEGRDRRYAGHVE